VILRRLEKQRFKKKIIDDYIFLLSTQNLCECFLLFSNLGEDKRQKVLNLQKYAGALIEVYLKILFKYDLLDLALAILSKEFLSAKGNLSAEVFYSDSLVDKRFFELRQMSENLKQKLKKINTNSFEMSYLKIDKLIDSSK
jgi:hypothetical protein